MKHDFHEQREETKWVWSDLSQKHSLPEYAVLELQFVPAANTADWDGFEQRLKKAGYRVHRYEDGSTMQASVGPIMLGFEAIWDHEFTTTKTAPDFGFHPDGWGFLSV